MAIIRGIDFGPVFTDIQSVLPNAFAQVGDTWYFGYINVSGHAVVYTSTDLGVTWSLSSDYGAWSFIAVTSTFDGASVVVTVTGVSYNQTLVYKDGALVMEADGTVAINGAVCMWPFLMIMADPYSNTGIGYPQSGSTPGFVQAVPIRGVIGYTPDGTGVSFVGPANYDIGPGWSSAGAAYVVNKFGYHLQNPNDPHSQLTLSATSTIQANNWPGLNSATLSGFLNFQDFSGFSTGGFSGYTSYNSDVQMRGTYFDGFSATDTTVIADRGFSGPHKTVTAGVVDGTLCALWVDSGGLIGTVINDQVGVSMSDSGGQRSQFGKGKIYGNQNAITWDPRAFCARAQSVSFTGFLLGKASTASSTDPYTLYRLNDPDVLNRPHALNAELYSQTTTITQSLPSVRDPFQINPSSNAVGTVSTRTTGPSFGISYLIEACTNPKVLANPNNSPGCSPILRELLIESGIVFSVTREMANDGDPYGHLGGNALDLAGPASPTVLTGASVTDAAYQEMAQITSFLRQVPSLFASVIHYDPITPGASLYIWDGRIVTAAQYGGVTAQTVKDATSNIHISSSFTRLLQGFQDPKVAAALGLSNPYTDPVTGNTTNAAATDPFTSDRYVYVNGDGYVGSNTVGLAAEKLPANIVNFW
jgi:hypothetical protein